MNEILWETICLNFILAKVILFQVQKHDAMGLKMVRRFSRHSRLPAYSCPRDAVGAIFDQMKGGYIALTLCLFFSRAE
jgi:hypothetical protein